MPKKENSKFLVKLKKEKASAGVVRSFAFVLITFSRLANSL
jgi:hypothetical protein